MSFAIYVLGFLIMLGGLIYAAVVLHVSGQWITIGSIILIGIGIVTGVTRTRTKDPS